MGSLLAYSGISTKIRSMRSQILTDREFEQIAQLATVNEAAEFLRKKPVYNEVFSEAGEHTLHRGTIEKLLFFTEYHDFVKLYRFAGVQLREYLELYFMEYERTFLKSVVRSIIEQRESEIQIASLGEFFKKHASFSSEMAAKARTMEELMQALYHSPYYAQLHPIKEQGGTLFDYEMALDSYVITKTWKEQKKRFQGEACETLCRTYGYQIDLLNLIWIYRSKKYYNLSAAEIYGILLPVYYKLNKATVSELVEASSLEEFQTLVDHTYYGRKYGGRFEIEEDRFYLEGIYYALLYHIHNQEFQKHPFSVAAVNSYLYMKRLETQRLVTTIEGIRYGLPPQTIIEHERRYHLEVLNR